MKSILKKILGTCLSTALVIAVLGADPARAEEISEWAIGTVYYAGKTVGYDGLCWQCLREHTSEFWNAPGSGPGGRGALWSETECGEESTTPTLTLVEPDGADDAADTSYTVTWTDEDSDDDATIALYYDTDDTGEDGTLIVGDLSEDDETDAHDWDTSSVAEGAYYVYGIIDDGASQAVAYSAGAVTITRNEAPTAVDDNIAVNEGETTANIHETLLENDTDPDADDVLSISSVDDSGTTGELTAAFHSGSESLTYTASGFEYLEAGAVATDFFTYTITDAVGATGTATVLVTITGMPNNPPSGGDNTINPGVNETHTFTQGNFIFSDPDNDDFLAVTIATVPDNGSLQLDGTAVAAGDSIAVTDIDAGSLTFTPAADETGEPYASFTFQVRDDGGTEDGGVDLDQTPNTMTIDVEGGSDGEYTLVPNWSDAKAYLVDGEGQVAREWTLSGQPRAAVYFIDYQNDGDHDLLAGYYVENDYMSANGSGGGGIEILDWSGASEWNYVLSDDRYYSHHDVEPLPNGNILILSFERLDDADEIEALGFGGTDEIWGEAIFEINPATNEIVWEWHVINHLLPEGAQARDYPHLVDPNANRDRADWLHVNAIDYNEARDEIVLSSRNFSEIWIISHAIDTEDTNAYNDPDRDFSAGDLLYRWGNPASYGGAGEQTLDGQHNAHWIDPTSADSNILLFDNDVQGGNSTVVELDAEYDSDPATDDATTTVVWEYGDDADEEQFYSSFISGAQRLADGNTLICSGAEKWVFEVNGAGEKVWEFSTDHIIFRAERYYLDAALF